jgi:hypothetical protein
MQEKAQVLYSDIMHIDYKRFLISVVEPLQLTIQAHLQDESSNQIGVGLQGNLNVLQALGFVPTMIYTNPAAGFCSLIGCFQASTLILKVLEIM